MTWIPGGGGDLILPGSVKLFPVPSVLTVSFGDSQPGSPD